MKTISNLIILGLVTLTTSSAFDILGIELPELERLQKSERQIGMPFVHDHPKNLLGIL